MFHKCLTSFTVKRFNETFCGKFTRYQQSCINYPRLDLTAMTQIRHASEFAYKLSGFCKYGLMRDDCLHEDEDVKEALRRYRIACPDGYDARTFRIFRAMQLSLQRDILPKEKWTKLEEDELYLTPLVQQIVKEREEREEWEKIY